MRASFRLAIVLGAIVIFSGGTAATSSAQQFDTLFAKARQLEKDGKRREAVREYRQVSSDQHRDPEAAAEALYQAGLLASQGYGTTPELKEGGEAEAVEIWGKQLAIQFPNTKAFKELTGGSPGSPEDKLFVLQTEIDKRNSKLPRYQILDTLVRITGKNPNVSYGLALIALAVLVKLILFPLTKKQYASMREMQKMQPLIKKLQEQYKGKEGAQAEVSKKTMELYKEHGVNPFAGCWPALVQLPFLIFVFTAIREYEFAFSRGHFLWIGSPLADQGWKVYGFEVIGKNLASPDIPLLALYAVTNFITMKMTPASDPMQQQQQNTMAWMMSGVFFFMFVQYRWSSAFVLYWLALNCLSIWQQYEFIYKPHKERMKAGDIPPPGSDSPSKNGAGAPAPEAKPVTQAARVRPRKKKK